MLALFLMPLWPFVTSNTNFKISITSHKALKPVICTLIFPKKIPAFLIH